MKQVGAFEKPFGLDLALGQGDASTRVMRPAAGASPAVSGSRAAVIGLLLAISLLAFEVFNFDTTRYALTYFLGEVSFLSIRWATILALAFCAIDFAGLGYLLGPGRSGTAESREAWYLMGAWLLGATMNALMTWWAVSLTLLNHELGNELVGREQLLKVVPIFVALLVWLTRILFIGAFSVAGDRLFRDSDARLGAGKRPAEPAFWPTFADQTGAQAGVRPGEQVGRRVVEPAPTLEPLGVPRPQIGVSRPSAVRRPARPAAPRPVTQPVRPAVPVGVAAAPIRRRT